MRKALALVGAVVALLSIAVTGASGISRPQTFSVIEIDESDASTNVGFDFQREPKPGDRFAMKSGLYKWAGVKRGARIGYDNVLCTFVRVPAPLTEHSTITAHCVGGFHLSGGQIVAEGFIDFSNGPLIANVPVVGGTGAYGNARGWVHVHDIGVQDSGHSALTFHLLP
jgi:hypothetical protein